MVYYNKQLTMIACALCAMLQLALVVASPLPLQVAEESMPPIPLQVAEEAPVEQLEQSSLESQAAEARSIYHSVLAKEGVWRVPGFHTPEEETLIQETGPSDVVPEEKEEEEKEDDDDDDDAVEVQQHSPARSTAKGIYSQVLRAAKPVGEFHVEVKGYHAEPVPEAKPGGGVDITELKRHLSQVGSWEHTKSGEATLFVQETQQFDKMLNEDAVVPEINQMVHDFNIEATPELKPHKVEVHPVKTVVEIGDQPVPAWGRATNKHSYKMKSTVVKQEQPSLSRLVENGFGNPGHVVTQYGDSNDEHLVQAGQHFKMVPTV